MTLVLALSIATPAFAEEPEEALDCGVTQMTCKIQSFFLTSSRDGIKQTVKEFEFFIVKPDSILENKQIKQYYKNATDFSQVLITIMFIYKLIELLATGDPEARGDFKNKIVKLVFTCAFAFSFATFFRWLLTFNNWYVKSMLNDGLSFDTFALKQSDIDNAVNTGMSLILLSILSLILLIMMIVMLFQTASRLAELGFGFAIAPIIIATNLADNFNLLPGFWRNLLSVIFTQAVQVTMMVFMVNAFANTNIWEMHNMFLAVGYMFLVVKAPTFVKELIWSSGTGKVAGGIGANVVSTFTKEFIRRKI